MNEHPQATQPRVAPLLIPSLHIRGFRAFRDLEVPNLGRVNLVVGKNNVGKTTLLEALRLYTAGAGAVWVLNFLLEQRQELQRPPPQDDRAAMVNLPRAFSQGASALSVSPIGSIDRQMKVWLGMGAWNQEPGSRRRLQPVSEEEAAILAFGTEELVPLLRLSLGTRIQRSYAISRLNEFLDSRPIDEEGMIVCVYVQAHGIDNDALGRLWNGVALTEREADVLKALQIVAPEVERLSFIVDTYGDDDPEWVAVILKKGQSAPEPLRSLGDGMNRILEIALGLANSRNGILLIDELENGIHYSAQEQLWRFIFEASSLLNVQVFATTHSWDCIEAFQQAAAEHKEAGALIRLSKQADDVKATVFNERDLAIMTRESIEVR